MKPCPILLFSNSTHSTTPMAGRQYLGGQQRWVGINLITHSSALLCLPPLCVSTALPKHGDPSDGCFPDFQRACTRGRGGILLDSSCAMTPFGLRTG